MKQWLPLILSILGVACGGGDGDGPGGSGGSGGSGSSVGQITIRKPINGNGNYVTIAPSVEIAGNAFVSPENVDCKTVFPARLSMSWTNSATGQSGSGGIASGCQTTFLGLQWYTRWSIADDAIDLQIGENPISIRITDNQGKVGTATIVVERLDDTVPPFIVSHSPATDAIDIPINRNITVRFSESMHGGSLSAERLTLVDADGQTINGFRSYDRHNYTWQFDPQFNLHFSTTYTVTVDGDVQDEFGGNTMGADNSWSFTTAASPDFTPPEVTVVTPGPGTQCVAPDTSVFAQFSETLSSSSVDRNSFALKPDAGSHLEATVRYNGVSAELEPLLPLLAGTEYTATLAASIADLAGNTLGSDFSWTFQASAGAADGDWLQTSASNAPVARHDHTAIWTGSEMIVWGGYGWIQSAGFFGEFNDGGRYDPATDTWNAMSTTGALPKSEHSAIFTGTEMIVWGGDRDSGARYLPSSDTWLPMTTSNAPSARTAQAAIWTGTEMIIWGGQSISGSTLDTGARYNPATDSWTTISTDDAPSARRDMAYVWTGTELIVWGGIESRLGVNFRTDGARYNPVTDTWTPLPTATANSGTDVKAVWTGTEMLVWQGGLPTFVDSHGFPVKESTLHAYSPATNTWRTVDNDCEPYFPGDFHMHWTGNRMFVLANGSDGGYFYDPAVNEWRPITTNGATTSRSGAASVWGGTTFLLWGGRTPGGSLDSGYLLRE